jgi:hypothetical protein
LVRRLKQLEAENARLKKAIADLTLEKVILKGAGRRRTGGNLSTGGSSGAAEPATSPSWSLVEALGEQGTGAVQEGDGQHAADGGEEHVEQHMHNAPGREGTGASGRSALFDTEVPCATAASGGGFPGQEGLAR